MKPNIKYRNKEWLKRHYIDLNEHAKVIAKECNVNNSTIFKWLKRYDIPRKRKMKGLWQNKEWFKNQVENLKKSDRQIAKELGIDGSTVSKWRRKFKIKNIYNSFNSSDLGKNHPNWKGGKNKTSHGYVLIYRPDHPRAMRGYVYEHTLIAEQMLGRSLKYFGKRHKNNEVPHHIDGNGLNNEPDNIYICKNQIHHNKVQGKLFSFCFQLVQKGIIKFDREKGEYYLL